MLYTAQYRYPGKDRLDITVKGNDVAGKLYAPTWEMVTDYKRTNNKEAYTRLYYDLLIQRWKDNIYDFRASTLSLVDMVAGTETMPARDITLVCFCMPATFCHRYLLVKWLQHNYPHIKYGGERK